MELNLYVMRRERSGRADGLQRVRHEARLSSPVSTVRAEMAAVGARRRRVAGLRIVRRRRPGGPAVCTRAF